MTVAELIKELQDCPPTAIVLFKQTYAHKNPPDHLIVEKISYRDYANRYITLAEKPDITEYPHAHI